MIGKKQRILVIGAGVNGSICAAGLFAAGIDVTLLARGARFDAIKERGVLIEDPFTGTTRTTPVPVVDRLDPDDAYDFIFVVVRKNQIEGLLPVLARNATPNLVFMVNNPSGVGEYVEALGAERIILGFVFGAGRRVGDVVRGFSPKGIATPFGEIDGRKTDRLLRLVGVLKSAGFNAKTEKNMPDWQATHAALVAPFAMSLMRFGNDNYRLAESKADVRAATIAMRETVRVLKATGHRIVPGITEAVFNLPLFVLVPCISAFLSKKIAEVGGAWHCMQAPDEMNQLAKELRIMVDASGLAVPTLRKILEPAR